VLEEPRGAAPSEGRLDENAAAWVERMLPGIFLAVRAIHVGQGILCWATGRRSYHRPRLMGLLTLSAAAELGWLVHRTRSGGHNATSARVDALFGTVGLVIVAASTSEEDRTSSMNWMMPLSVGGALGCAFALGQSEGLALTTGMATAYTVSVSNALTSKEGRAGTAVANIASYPGFFLVGRIIVIVARRMASEIDASRRREVERSGELAAEQERNAAHRMIHDSALQTLEVLSRDTGLSQIELQNIARTEATVLRRSITDGAQEPGNLVTRLRAMADRFGRRGLSVELVTVELVEDPDPVAVGALCDAAGEALTNVLKHAAADSVVVRLATVPDGVKLTVRDHGKGYDTATNPGGFGQRNSIRARMAEVGGRGEIWSEPGHGTRVELRVPVEHRA
jgi:signal transduction histidine kinase